MRREPDMQVELLFTSEAGGILPVDVGDLPIIWQI